MKHRSRKFFFLWRRILKHKLHAEYATRSFRVFTLHYACLIQVALIIIISGFHQSKDSSFDRLFGSTSKMNLNRQWFEADVIIIHEQTVEASFAWFSSFQVKEKVQDAFSLIVAIWLWHQTDYWIVKGEFVFIWKERFKSLI